ncbi:hypothetical protein K8R30_01325 [archaeon]|nr:hypothetical protein [archaeon]
MSKDFWIDNKKIWGRPHPAKSNDFLKVGELMFKSVKSAEILLREYHRCFPRPPPTPKEEEKEARANIKNGDLRGIDPFERQIFIDPQDYNKITLKLLGGMGSPFTKLLSSIGYNSIGFFGEPSLFNKFKNYEVVKKLKQKIIFCKDCGEAGISIVKNDIDLPCGHESKRDLSLYNIKNKDVLYTWKHNPACFLEDICYYILKDLGYNPYRNVDLYKAPIGNTKKRITEFDFILSKEKIVILCSVDPTQRREKSQVKKAKDLGYKIIFVSIGKKVSFTCDKKVCVEISEIKSIREKIKDAISELN